MRNQIHERIIKLKSQSKWIVRIFTLTGIILGFIFAFTGHPIGGTNAENIPSAYEVTYHPEANVSYTLNGNENFTAGLITITDGTETYTIMDRNLGATAAGTGCEDDLNWGDACAGRDPTYGYHFQRGNNYGFAPCTDSYGCTTFGNSATTGNTQVDASEYGPGNYYSSSTFIRKNPWDSSNNNNLRGGEDGTNEAMQGPCPEGYHVPSSEEWLGLSTMLGYDESDFGEGSIQAIRNKLYLPFAGYRYYSSAVVSTQGTDAFYWSSTAYSAGYEYGLYFDSSGLYPQNVNSRSDGLSVRCFKNSPYSTSSEEECPTGQHLATGGVCVTNDKDIVLQATATSANQTLKINKYFANEYTVDRGDGTTGNLTADTTHTYASAGTYNIILSTAADRWTFSSVSKPLVPKDGTTMTGVKIIYIPSLEDGFGASATNPGDFFFSSFNERGALTSLPDGSFDTSNITTVGDYFFNSFNNQGALTSLPDGSFDTSKITTVGNSFFSSFNSNGALTSLPAGSFDTSKITTVGNNFFLSFNNQGALTSLPDGSFDTSKITTVGNNFFYYFNDNGALTSLPDSFKLTSAAYNKNGGYNYAFNSPNYTLNKNVSDLVEGITVPSSDRNTFSDNQPGRCGVHANWLESTNDQCGDVICPNPEGQHIETGSNFEHGYACVDNEQQVPCRQTGEIPGNSSYDIVNVTGVWNSGTSTWDIPACSWTCNTGYETGMDNNSCKIICEDGTHEENGECVVNEQRTGCLLTGEIPANSNYNIENVTGTWSSGINSWNVPACSWTCNTGYIESLNGQSCEKQNIATFNTSGVVTNGTITKSCTIHDNNIQSCDVTAPNLTGYVILGRSTNPSDSTPDYEIGETIPLMGDMTYYAITSPAIEFTGITPADNSAQNENYFTSQIDITTSNLSGFSSVLDGNEISLYDDSLVLMYNFDNVESLGESSAIVKDLSKYGNDGTIIGTVTYTGNGVRGGAYDFGGGKINAGHGTGLTATNNFTVSVRLKTNFIDYDGNNYIVTRYNWNNNTRVRALGVSRGSNRAFVSCSTDGTNKNGFFNLYSSSDIVDGKWHFITIKHDGTKIYLYIDGNIEDSHDNTTLYDTGVDLILSRHNANDYRGQMDELRIYNRALSKEEINTLYHSNLSKIALNKWTYTIGFTGLAGGTHTYGGIMSDTLGSTGVSRTINICGAGYEIEDGQTCKKSNVQVTFIANPSTFSDGRFSGGDTSKTLEYFFATGGYYAAKTEEIQIPQNPHEYDSSGNLLTGWMFEGWYLDTGYSAASRWTGLSADTPYTGITLYARYLPFKDKTVTRDGVTFTIMDRNMGALDYSSGYSYQNEQSNTDRIGLYYQRGNNFGFPNTGKLSNTTIQGVLIENFTNKERGPGNYYFNGSFAIRIGAQGSWNSGSKSYENFRGGGGKYAIDSINKLDIDKQGPCPEGYHIPHFKEWSATENLFNQRAISEVGITYCNSLSNSAIQYCMPAILGLPFAGDRFTTSSNTERRGTRGTYWTTTAYNSDNAMMLLFDSDRITSRYGERRSFGYSVRCFKDATGVTLSYDSKGGTAVASSTERRWFAKSTAPTNPTRTGSTFAGWYRDTGYTDEFIFSGDTYISEDTTLYAKWTCKAGYEMDGNGDCKKSNVQVTFVANPSTFSDGRFSGEITSKTLEYFFATGGYYAAVTEEIQIPQNPHEYDLSGNLLTGWMFEGWYLDTGYSATSRWTGLSENTIYTGITLYARYLPFKDKTVTRDGVTFTIMDRNLGALDYSSGYSYDNEQSNETGPDGTRIRIGNYYQRGNNFGFPNKSRYNNKLTNSVSNYSNIVRGPGNYYFNGIFITNNPIYNEYNKNMWGGSGETQNNANSDIDKQGPCPIGYHIPSTYERISTVNLYNKRKNTTEGISYCSSMPSGDQFCMPAALGLPFDGYLGTESAGLAALTTARFRSTNVYGRSVAYDLGFRANILLPQYSDSMGYGLTIRCLKNTPDLVLNFDSKGGNNIQSKTGFKRWNPLTIASSKPNNPTRTNSRFVGWYKDTGYTDEFIFSGDTYISEDTTLYAKWTCNTGYIESLDGQSCEENILPYTINHYQENTGNNGYTLFESENKTGLSDNLTQATSNTYQGFTAQAFQQQTIQGNDTHVDIYYDRNVYTININLNGGTGPTSFTGKYGDTVVPPEITKSGYSIKKRVPALPETMPLNGFSSKPVRVLTDGSISISVNPNKNTLDLSIRGTSNNSRELTGAFTNDYFTISDTKGEENGYHATLSIGNLVGNDNVNHIIPASNVQVKTDGIVRLSGAPSSEVGLTTTMTNWRTATGQVTYFTRGDIVIDDECKPGEYGINLDLKITVPSYTIPDNYHGTITYTLYED